MKISGLDVYPTFQQLWLSHNQAVSVVYDRLDPMI
jgi:hypothetical protein